MGIKDKALEKSLHEKIDDLERAIDYVGPTPLRHFLSNQVVFCRAALRTFDQQSYEASSDYVWTPPNEV